MSAKWCMACRVDRDTSFSRSEAFVLGLMIADLQRSGRRRTEGSLCDSHARFPHKPSLTGSAAADAKGGAE